MAQPRSKPRVPARRRSSPKGRAPRLPPAGGPPAKADDATHIQGALTVDEFLTQAEAEPLAPEQRERIVDQALLLLQDFYVHLPLKRAMHASDPVQRLRLLRTRHTRMSDRRFHDVMIEIVASVRDLHTNYVLPRPYKGKVAFLPFMLEDCYEEGTHIYLVTKALGGITDPDFQPGVQVIHWNGVPIDRVVELSAAREPGSNDDARHARGLERLTVRSLGLSAPPDEQWVIVGYRRDGAEKEIRLTWQVFDPAAEPEGEAAAGPAAQLLGVDLQRQIVGRVRKRLFAKPEDKEQERRVMAAKAARRPVAAAADLTTTSTFPEALSFKTVANERYGYIRIWTFAVADSNAFALEVQRICALLPQDGLILDVRGNGGGYVPSGELLLQLFTPRTIEPERFHFINSPRTMELCVNTVGLERWADSIRLAVETGAVYSQGFPLTDPRAANALGQVYVGPVLLITDALCYSTTDIFAAGFQDHEIGKILGVHGNTGAGGANVWGHDLLRQLWHDPAGPLLPLPNGAAMRLAIRQSTRVGRRLGVPLEDLGVVPDLPDQSIHRMTRRDLVGDNADLIAAAAAWLDRQPSRQLDAQIAPAVGGVRLSLRTVNLDRVDVFADGRANTTLDVADGLTAHDVRFPNGSAGLELKGYKLGQLVAARRVALA